MNDGLELWEALTDPQPWKQAGACSGMDPNLWFPQRGEPVEAARQVCRGCVVREDCLEYALAGGEKFGIWGGLTELERKTLRTRRRDSRRKAS